MISSKCTRNQILEELGGEFMFFDRKLKRKTFTNRVTQEAKMQREDSMLKSKYTSLAILIYN